MQIVYIQLYDFKYSNLQLLIFKQLCLTYDWQPNKFVLTQIPCHEQNVT